MRSRLNLELPKYALSFVIKDNIGVGKKKPELAVGLFDQLMLVLDTHSMDQEIIESIQQKIQLNNPLYPLFIQLTIVKTYRRNYSLRIMLPGIGMFMELPSCKLTILQKALIE